jgi:hypothetical protein
VGKFKRERMNAPDNFGAKGSMNGPVAFQSRHRGKFCGPHSDAKVTFATLAITGMPSVTFTFVNDFNHLCRKRRPKPFLHLIRKTHFFT